MYTQAVKKSNKTKGKSFLPDPLVLNNKLKRARDDEKAEAVKKVRSLLHIAPPSTNSLSEIPVEEFEELPIRTLPRFVASPTYNPYSPVYSPNGSYSPTSPQYGSPGEEFSEDDDDDKTYSPTSPQYESPKEMLSEDTEDEPDYFSLVFFGKLEKPYGFNTNEEKKDSYLLCADNEEPPCGNLQFALMAEKMKQRNYHAKDIRAYDNGTLVMKQCAPWGKSLCLFNTAFIIEKKVFGEDREVAFILLKEDSERDREYYIDAPFFSGWLDTPKSI